MTHQDLYKDRLLEHYRHPKNRCQGPINGATAVERGANPRCGDEVEIGIFLADETIEAVKFRGRGCAICIASASMMTQAASGLSRASARALFEQMSTWFGTAGEEANGRIPEDLQALSAVRDHPARQRCVMLSWEALAAALDTAEKG
jgi:nitrogen fixation NifU-like protein